MKKLILILAVVPSISLARDAALEELAGRVDAAGRSYEQYMGFRNQQMSSLQTALGQLYERTGGKYFDSMTFSGNKKFEVENLQTKIESLSRSVPNESVRVKADAVTLESQLMNRRDRYFNQLRELASREGVDQLRLRPEVANDLKFARATKGLNQTEFQRALKTYEGRAFGQTLTDRAQIKDIELREAKQVRVKTYHSQTEVTVRPGQEMRITTPNGDLVSGRVVGTLPDGRVLLEGKMPFGLEHEFPELARGRIVNLNDAADVKIYDQGSSRPREISVRYQAGDIREALRQNRLWDLANKPKANGEIAEVATIKPNIVDKRAGEVITNTGGFAGGTMK